MGLGTRVGRVLGGSLWALFRWRVLDKGRIRIGGLLDRRDLGGSLCACGNEAGGKDEGKVLRRCSCVGDVPGCWIPYVVGAYACAPSM